MLNIVTFQEQIVPEYITNGNSARFIKPFFNEVCKGDNGCEIGYGKDEWRLNPKAWCYDKSDPGLFENDIDYLNIGFKNNQFDWIFSSHCLEHIKDWKASLKVWTKHIKSGGVLFLYLPHRDCLYWRPELMPTKKHFHSFQPEELEITFNELGYKHVEYSGCDLAYSFGIYGEKI